MSIESKVQYYIDKKLINTMYALTLEELEICGNLKLEEKNKDGLLKLDDLMVGDIELDVYKKTRLRCKQKFYTHIFFHTHPQKTARTYPSVEDILKCVKRKAISIIATRWGLWIIKCESQIKDIDIKVLDDLLKKFYKIENYMGFSRERNTSSKSFDEFDLRTRQILLNDIINRIEEIKGTLGINMKLNLWKDTLSLDKFII